MKVKITKADKPTFWYFDRIGQIFDIEEKEHSDRMYKLLPTNHNWNIIETFPLFIKEGDFERID